MIEKTIAVTTHGRYLVEHPAGDSIAPLLVGFHGYAEPADAQLARLRTIPGADRWRIVSIQGLNRFYERRTNAVVAGWMTRQDRELAIAGNIAYVTAVIDAVCREWPTDGRLVFAGFSQGVAMTFRAAVSSARSVAGVIAVGGDVPPELEATALARVSRTLLCRGTADDWYTSEKFAADIERLQKAQVALTPVEFTGGHEWSAPVHAAASAFLQAVTT